MCLFVFFFKQKTAYEIYQCDWSSDVCSSDLNGELAMTIELKKWDSADHLKTKEDIAAYLEAVFEDGDPLLITHALGVVARAEGMTEVAKQTGLTRASLYKALSGDGNPEFSTVLKVVHALGLKMTVAA